MSMTGSLDGERGSYPDIVDALARNGGHAKTDARAAYRRMVFNVLISNVDDHLRNHGFVWRGPSGWSGSPGYDLNPTPTDVKARIRTTNIGLDEGTCSLDLVESAAACFGLSLAKARVAIRDGAAATNTWRDGAADAGGGPFEVNRMASAFEHDDLARARVS
jgi:serine/threonine-protein kinase HipA